MFTMPAKMRRQSSVSKPRQPKGRKSETSFHMNVAGLLNKHLAEPAFWTTFPAGGGGENRGKLLKSLGLKSGFPDILIIVPRELVLIDGRSVTVPFLYLIELKKFGKGELSANQLETQPKLTATGARVANCETLEQVHAALIEWQIPYRAESPRQAMMNRAIEKTFGHLENAR